MDTILSKCKESVFSLNKLSENDINSLLLKIKNGLINNKDFILEENKKDLEAAKNLIKPQMMDRLALNDKRIQGLCDSIDTLVKLPNYIGQVIEEIKRPNGLVIKKVRVPFGVIGAIFEARPNVAIDIACLCLKTKNACVLKGGKEAINTNIALVKIIKDAIKDYVDPNCVTLIERTDREATDELITKREFIDLLIPRGSKGLLQYIVRNAKIPFIETGAGNCSLYVEKTADIDMALNVALNAKHQRPSVCNAIENLLVDEEIAPQFLPKLDELFTDNNIELRAEDTALKYLKHAKLVNDTDYDTEYNDDIIAIKIVKNVNEAISFINLHSTKH
jgi:glutamate-5-semialdehyde dehydrogenase